MQRQRTIRFFAFIAVIILVFSTICDIAFAQYATIPYGSTGDNVRKMQDALKKKGFYKGRVDGEFGPETRRAVIRFQASLGITADGKPGNKTLTALYHGGKALNQVITRKANAVTATNAHSLYYGCTGSRVRALQHALRATGHYKGVIDAVYGDLTELAVRKFQASKGLHVDGIAGKETLARLNNAQTAARISVNFLLSPGSRGAEVSSAQRKLVSLTHLAAGSYTNGVYDAATKDAVSKWQQATNRPETGTLTESQYNALILN